MQLDEHGEPVVSPEEAARRARAEAEREIAAIDAERLPHATRLLNAAALCVILSCCALTAFLLAMLTRVIDVAQDAPRLIANTGMAVASIGIAIALTACWVYARERRQLLAERMHYARRLLR